MFHPLSLQMSTEHLFKDTIAGVGLAAEAKTAWVLVVRMIKEDKK